jgi:tRNA1Val (adenine37-N6)-methyltransferase
MRRPGQRYARDASGARSVASNAAALVGDEPEGWPDDAVCDRLIGDWCIWQRRRGHRTSTDDLLVAWFAAQHARAERPERYLDLGCGIGSVLLMTAHRLRPLESFGVEAQAQSALMATRSVAELPAGAPAITIRRADLRECDSATMGRFALISGSPPYFPLGTALPAADPQRRACRMELRGGVEAYCDAASRLLTDDGVFVLVHQTLYTQRVLDGAAAAGLALFAQADVRMREDRAEPFLSVYAFAPQRSAASVELPAQVERIELAVRDAAGEISSAYRAVRVALGVDAGSDPRES